MPRHFFIQTVGCQMNILDSELLAGELCRAGHEQVDAMGRADMILLNTCSVRQHAEDKIYSLLGRLKELKQRRPELIVGVLGCMAQKDRHEIFRRAPHVDLVVGPGQLGQLPALIERVAAGGGPQVEISLDRIGGDRAAVQRSFVQFSPDRTAAQPAGAASGDGADHVRLRQVLHVLRRAACPRAGTEPPGRGDRRGSSPPGRPRLPRSDAAGPDRQQLSRRHRSAQRRAGRSALHAARDRRHPPAAVRHQPSETHDRRAAPGDARLARRFRPTCTSRPRADRMRFWSG